MRFLFDSNAFAELVRDRPNAAFYRRFKQDGSDVVTASVVLYEMLYGLRRMPPSKRRTLVAEHILGIRSSVPILPYDARAADWHAAERRRLEELGLSTSFADGQIAAIAKTNGCTLVTHNLRHFEHFSDLAVETWIA